MRRSSGTLDVTIVVGDMRGRTRIAAIEQMDDALVFEADEGTERVRFACEVATGQPLDQRISKIEPIAGVPLDISGGGTRVTTRERMGKRELIRDHRGWIEPLFALADTAQHVVVDRLVVLFSLASARLSMTMVAPSGPIAECALPTWVLDEPTDWRVACATRAGAVVITTRTRAVWLSMEALQEIHRSEPGATIRFAPVLSTAEGDDTVVAVTGDANGDYGPRTFRIRDRAGKEFDVHTFSGKPVAAGDTFELRDRDGAYPLLFGKNALRVERMKARDKAPAAPTFPPHEGSVSRWLSEASIGRSYVTPQIHTRLDRLSELLGLDVRGEARDEAITAALGRRHQAPYNGAISAAMILYAYIQQHLVPRTLALVTRDAIERASREDVRLANSPRRWALVMMDDYQPFTLCLTAEQRAAIETERLLVFEPLPEYRPPPSSIEAAVAEIAALVEAPPGSIRADAKTITLTVTAAALVEAALSYLPEAT